MNHTECEDCKLRNGDCGHHFKMNGKGKTNYDIPSLTACDKYGDCMFFQREEKPQGDLISRKALKEDFDVAFFEDEDDYKKALRIIDNVPPVDISKEIWDKSNELLNKRLSYLGRPRGRWIVDEENELYICPFCNERHCCKMKFCGNCGADMREGEERK